MLVDIHTVNMASMHTCSSTNVAFSKYYASLTSSAKLKHHEKVFTCGFDHTCYALKKQIEELMKELSTLREGIKMADNKPRRSSEETIQVDPKDLQFYSDSYDELRTFYKHASDKLKMIKKNFLTIESRVDELPVAIDASEAYNYQCNLKSAALPSDAEQESTKMTANLCLKLFAAMGV